MDIFENDLKTDVDIYRDAGTLKDGWIHSWLYVTPIDPERPDLPQINYPVGAQMMKVLVKVDDESQFLYETPTDVATSKLLDNLIDIFDGQLKIKRLCAEIMELADHGIMLPPYLHGYRQEQLDWFQDSEEWHDEWTKLCLPRNGSMVNPDENCLRNGKAPVPPMANLLKETCKDAFELISPVKVKTDVCLTEATVMEALQILRGAVLMVYPLGLPPHDPIRVDFDQDPRYRSLTKIINAEMACLKVDKQWFSREVELSECRKDLANRTIMCYLEVAHSDLVPPKKLKLLEEKLQAFEAAHSDLVPL